MTFSKKVPTQIPDDKVFILWSFDSGCTSLDGVYQTFELAKKDLNKIVKDINATIKKRKSKYETLFEKNDVENHSDEYVLLSFSSNLKTIEIRWMEMNKNYGEINSWYA